MTKLTLISSPTCPFVQRAVIVLAEKAVAVDIVYVDLAAKPDWFLALSPLGKVPVLKVERTDRPDAILFESAVILEYLEETTGTPHLHPADPLERAHHRAWIEFGSTILLDLFRFGTATDDAAVAAARDVLDGKFQRLEHTLAEGPFFAGVAFSYVDAVYAPAFRQIDAIETVSPTALLDRFPKISAWRRSLSERPSVRNAVPADFTAIYLARLRKMDARILRAAA